MVVKYIVSPDLMVEWRKNDGECQDKSFSKPTYITEGIKESVGSPNILNILLLQVDSDSKKDPIRSLGGMRFVFLNDIVENQPDVFFPNAMEVVFQ